MAHTKVTKTYSQNTGVANTFSYSGSFDVFKGSEVVVTLDAVSLTFTSSTINESASPREYTVDTSAKTIHIGGADLSSGTIIIRPETDMGAPTPRATYTPGASITSEDLNNNQTQLLRKAMEYDETKMTTTGDTMTGNLTMGQNTTIIFEGATDDAYETTLTVADPASSDKTITLPNTTGTVVTTGDTGTVTATMLAADSVDSSELVDGSIDTSHIAASQVTTAKIAADNITNALIADNQIDSEHYVDGSIDTAHIADANVTLAKIENVTSTQIIVGNGSNRPAAVAVSGDATLANDGALTIANDAVEIAMIGCEQTTISDSDSHIPTSGAVVDYVTAAIAPIGGFEAIADEDNFPTTVPNAGVIVSIADATGVTVDGSGTSTTARTAGNGSDNVTINNFPSSMNSAAVPASTGLLVISTGSSHTYNFHRLLPTTADVRQLSDDVNDFFARYRIASSAPGSDNDAGDLYFNTSDNTLYVRNSANNAWVTGVASTATTATNADHVSVADNESTDENDLIPFIENASATGNVGLESDGDFHYNPSSGTVTATNFAGSTATFTGDVTFDNGADAGKDLVWDVSADSLIFNDSVKAVFGTNSDADIYHNDTDFYIDNDKGDINIRANVASDVGGDIHLMPHDDEYGIKIIHDAGVQLFYNNVNEVETVSGGVKLNGYSECAVNALGDVNSNPTFDFTVANYITMTLTGNVTVQNPTTESVGQSGSIIITQDGTGSRTCAWSSQFKWTGGTAPTLTTTAGAVDRIDYLVVAADTIHCVASLDVK